MNDETILRRTPLSDHHATHGARMVPFAGWWMPVQYSGVLEEARAVRDGVGVFDISHMGRFRVTGEGSAGHLQRCLTNDVYSLGDGQAQYTLLLAEDGGILDDLIIYRLSATEFVVVVNAVNTTRDREELLRDIPPGTTLEDETTDTAMIAVQGPEAAELVSDLAGFHASAIGRFHVARGTFAGVHALFCRTGYTGEDGFEIIVPAQKSIELWQALLDSNAVPCGLGARDTLRIEAGYPLYGHEIHEGTNPVEAGLMWAVKLDKGQFRGRDAVARARRSGVARKLMGLIMAGRMVPRQGYPVLEADGTVGEVTSGTFSPVREAGIGMAYVAADKATPERQVLVQIRGSLHAAHLVRKTDLLKRLAS